MKDFFKNLVSFWAETWRENKVLFFAEAIGTFTSMFAAGIMSFQTPNPNLLLVYIFYTLGAIFMGYAFYIRRSSWMIVLMAYYTIVTSIGIVNLFV